MLCRAVAPNVKRLKEIVLIPIFPSRCYCCLYEINNKYAIWIYNMQYGANMDIIL